MMIKIYEVGGSIRDEILGLKSKDKDYCVEAKSYDVMRDYIASKGKIYLEKPEFATIRAKFPELGDVDFVLCRKDGNYSDGRRPDEIYAGTLLDDLSRRDFTCNAIARDIQTGEIFDPFDGISDLLNRVLVCVGNPKDRFSEDALRLIRAIRFSITKNLELHHSVEDCLYDCGLIESLKNVSPERIREELYKCFYFDTLETLKTLQEYRDLRDFIFDYSGVWLKPTMEK